MHDAGGLPPASIGALDAWRSLASWLLVAGEPQFRKAVDKRDGFPSPKSGSGGADHTARIAAMEAILAELAAVPGLAEALDAARRLPPPCYTEEAWAVVVALLDLLPRLAARLTLAFRDAGALDFTQGMLGALAALGSEERPSDLLLALDLRIDHLLIDEFQDTSFTQLELLRLLTAGWQPGDGHTLFAVGDPMQSIYRFREAEVRIFVEAQAQQQVAGVPVESLVLARNFRSHAGLVAWVNDVFPRVFPGRSDPWRGAVAFAPAIAGNDAPPGPRGTLQIVADDASEADRVVALVHAALGAGDGSVAVLVRARTHLDRVLPALREADIAYTAVELDALSERQAILDLVSLTHALIQPADRLAWLAVLRAPWCGLSLADLVAVVAAADAQPSHSIAALLETPAAIAGLSDAGRERFVRVARCLVPAIASRGRATLARPRARRVARTWRRRALRRGDRYRRRRALFRSARRIRRRRATSRTGLRSSRRSMLFAPRPRPMSTTRVQVMTLHRAKGLEFDTVIMPGLARTQRSRDAEVLRWRAREQGLLLAPARRRGGEAEPGLRISTSSCDRRRSRRALPSRCTSARRAPARDSI